MDPAENRRTEHHEMLVDHHADAIKRAHAPILAAIDGVEAAIKLAREDGHLPGEMVFALTGYLRDLSDDLEWYAKHQAQQEVAFVEEQE